MIGVSVVIASQDAGETLPDCLRSLAGQHRDGEAELIVADNSRDGSAQVVERQFPQVRLIRVSGRALLPELWARGAEVARGRIVAFTTAQFVPNANWIAEIKRHHTSSHAGVGGSVENAQPSPAARWAVYFCRYAAYMPPFAPHTVNQIAGDNASYQRWVLERYADLVKTGFWEHTINDRLRRDGHTLLLAADLLVTYKTAFGVWAFCRQRLTHGRIFGEERATSMSAPRRAMYLILSPAIPLIFLGKISRAVLANGRHTGAFVRAFPLVALFVLSWSIGEVFGSLHGWFLGTNTSVTTPRVGPAAHR